MRCGRFFVDLTIGIWWWVLSSWWAILPLVNRLAWIELQIVVFGPSTWLWMFNLRPFVCIRRLLLVFLRGARATEIFRNFVCYLSCRRRLLRVHSLMSRGCSGCLSIYLRAAQVRPFDLLTLSDCQCLCHETGHAHYWRHIFSGLSL